MLNSNKKLSRIIGVLLCSLTLAATFYTAVGCQTTKGAGKDIENLGDNIKDTAERND